MIRLLIYIIVGLAFTPVGVAPANAQTILWQVNSSISPTLLPAYAGQPSPFESSSNTPASEAEEAARLARLKALQEAEEVLNGDNALQPNLGDLAFTAQINGPQGARVLFNDRWIGLGHTVAVPLQISPAAQQALALLRQHDTQAADTLAGRLQARLLANPQRPFNVAEISKEIIKIQTDDQIFRISLSSSGL